MTVYTDLNDAPAKHYGMIYADPAWRFKTYAAPQEGQKGRRDAERYYPTMTFDEMKALPVKRIAAKNCVLVMWTSWPHLLNALALIKAWGFTYKSSFKVWVKTKRSFSKTKVFMEYPTDFHTGTGYTTRKNSEFCLVATRGSPKRLARDVRELVVGPVREHSRKPEFYDDLERYCAGPRLEMNARTVRDGWDQWGNQVEMFPQPPAVARTPIEEIAAQPVAQDLFAEAAE